MPISKSNISNQEYKLSTDEAALYVDVEMFFQDESNLKESLSNYIKAANIYDNLPTALTTMYEAIHSGASDYILKYLRAHLLRSYRSPLTIPTNESPIRTTAPASKRVLPDHPINDHHSSTLPSSFNFTHSCDNAKP